MNTRTATVTLAGDGLRLDALTGRGHRLVLDNLEGNAGPQPADLIPVAVAACTAMDVVSILRKKRQHIGHYEVRASGEQRDDVSPHVFTRIDVLHVIEGPSLEAEAVRRSIELSATRYCSVGGTLSTGVTEVHHSYLLRQEDGTEETAEVVVTGPGEVPGALGQRQVAPASAG